MRQANADEVGDSQMILADKICEQPPIKYIQSILAYILPVHTCYWEKGY